MEKSGSCVIDAIFYIEFLFLEKTRKGNGYARIVGMKGNDYSRAYYRTV